MTALSEELIEGKDSILEAWRKAVGPSRDAGFASSHRKGRFADPAGYHAARGIEAVRDEPPSAALAFLFDLKPVIRSAAGKAADEEDLRALDARIDALSLHAFDCYVACRNRIAQLRVDEVQRGEKMLRRQLEGIRRNGEELA